MLVPFHKGKEQGTARQWYENGQLREQRTYETGEKTGEHKGWWGNGKQILCIILTKGSTRETRRNGTRPDSCTKI